MDRSALFRNVFYGILSCGLFLTMTTGSIPSQAWSKSLASFERATDSDTNVLFPLQRMSRHAPYNENRRHHHHHHHHHRHHKHHSDLRHQDQRIEDAFHDQPLPKDNLSSRQLRYDTNPIGEVNAKDLKKVVTSLKVVEEQLQRDQNEEELEHEVNEPAQVPLQVKENLLSMELETSSQPTNSMTRMGRTIENLDLGDTNRENLSHNAPSNRSGSSTSLSKSNHHWVEEEAQRKEKLDQFMKSFENQSQVQGERTTLKKMDQDQGNEAMDCPDCHGNRVCDKRTKTCRIPCGPGYPVCPHSESCFKAGFCSKVNEWRVETASPRASIDKEYSENHDYAHQDTGRTNENSTHLELLKDEIRLSEQKIMPIVQNGLNRLKTSLKIVFQDMIEEFGFGSVVVQKIE